MNSSQKFRRSSTERQVFRKNLKFSDQKKPQPLTGFGPNFKLSVTLFAVFGTSMQLSDVIWLCHNREKVAFSCLCPWPLKRIKRKILHEKMPPYSKNGIWAFVFAELASFSQYHWDCSEVPKILLRKITPYAFCRDYTFSRTSKILRSSVFLSVCLLPICATRYFLNHSTDFGSLWPRKSLLRNF